MPHASVDSLVSDGQEPTAAELAVIESEQPILAAEYQLFEAHLAVEVRPSRRAVRRVRRAAVRLMAAHQTRARGASALVTAPPERWGWAR